MSLEIRLLGGFETLKAGEPLAGFESNSDRALLAYLACEPGRSFSRAVLAEMLWPDRPQGAALSNLRHTLSVLRRVLEDAEDQHHIVAGDRNTVSLRDTDAVRVDVVEFEQCATIPTDSSGAVDRWRHAVELWRGPFLDGLTLRAGSEWDEWVAVTGERHRRHLVSVLRRLADHHERSGASEQALSLAARLVEVNPWDEQDHRRLMHLMAATGDRAGAIAHYERLSDQLQEEVGTVPSPRTEALIHQIMTGDKSVGYALTELTYPAFLSDLEPPATPLFVGRRQELDRLHQHLEAASSGKGRIVLIAGEAGSGKTMLAGEFARGAAFEHGDVLVTRGRCNAYAGFGDPYLPFREVMGQLTGDVEVPLGSGLVDQEQATRLWEAIPISARLTAERGPSLLGIMVDAGALVARSRQAVTGAGWLEVLEARARAITERPPSPERQQAAIFEEYMSVLEGVSSLRTLVMVIDDLQWADRGSVALLWHLARRLAGSRILLVGLYRPEEVDTEAHPLSPILSELQAAVPDGTISLGVDRGFIDDLIDSEPNDLDEWFRDRLFSFTGGHPLYTVEMVRGLQDRGGIRRTSAGVWTVGESLDWDRLPDRVTTVVAQRIGRLPKELQRDLEVAAVQGEEFIAETVAEVRGDPLVPARLGAESSSPHAVIEPAGARRIDHQLTAHHAFRHILFQRYLYGRLEPADRMRLHELTGRALEALYEDHPDVPVVDLAHHFDRAGLIEPAVDHLFAAGQRAYLMSANDEAIQLLGRAHELISELEEGAGRDKRELALLLPLVASVMTLQGYAAPEVGRLAQRIRELCARADPDPLVVMALIGVTRYLQIRGQYRESKALAVEARAIAESLGAKGLSMVTFLQEGFALLWIGDARTGQQALRRAWETYDPERDAGLKDMIGADPRAEAMSWDAVTRWYRGYPDQAVSVGDASIEWARGLPHPFTLCHALCMGGASVRSSCGDYSRALEYASEAYDIATTEHFPFWQACAEMERGVAIGHLGDPATGIEMVERGLAGYRMMGAPAFDSYYLCDVAWMDQRLGHTERGLERCDAIITDAIAFESRFSEIRARVTRGRLLVDVDPDLAATELEQLVATTRATGARWYELQAATALARLLGQLGRPADARQVLEPVVTWFSEGFDQPRLVEAREVLAAL